jgi:hypothetical protein
LFPWWTAWVTFELKQRVNIRALLPTPAAHFTLRCELGLVVDLGLPLVKLCYLEEGDGFLAPRVYAKVEEVHIRLQQVLGSAAEDLIGFAAPSLVDTITREYGDVWAAPHTAALLETLPKGKGVLVKFEELQATTWRTSSRCSRFCRLLEPSYIRTVTVASVVADISLCAHHPALVGMIHDLRTELPAYHGEAINVPADVDLLEYWRTRSLSLPHFHTLAKEAILVQPSSASAERVFAALDWMFSKQQERTLADYKSLSVKLRYNEQQRLKPQ